ncbi:tRNA-intron lyase [Methanogenium cariaci]
MKARRDGTTVVLGKDGHTLYDQSGYGRKTADGLSLSPEEALYLVLKKKITVEGESFESLITDFSSLPGFMRRFLVYRDMRERGYVILPGPQDFRVFRRGERPGTGRTNYLIRVLSERDLITFRELAGEVESATHMRKQFVLAAVDDEDELTYYDVKTESLKETGAAPDIPQITGIRAGNSVITNDTEAFPDSLWFGTKLDSARLMLSPMETLYLLDTGVLTITGDENGEAIRQDIPKEDAEWKEKSQVYAYLRSQGQTPRTAYKFGHHFRVYSGEKKHSELLVHALPADSSLPMSVISRSVRLAHSVRKKMLFACTEQNGIEFVEFARIKL